MEQQSLSVGEALLQAHNALDKDLAFLKRPVTTPAEMSQRLAMARQHLRQHFRFEEEGGYMDMVLRGQPNLHRRVEQLHEEHETLDQMLTHLIAEAAAATKLDASFQRKIQCWIDELKAHESRENEFVEVAFTQDIGQKD